MNEHGFVKAVHNHLRKTPDIRIWKINDNYAGGVPDAWYCAPEGRNLWIEYKYINAPKRDTTIIDVASLLAPLQRQWMVDHVAYGISCAIVIGSESGILMYSGIEWRIQVTAKTIKNGLKPKDVSLWIANKLMPNDGKVTIRNITDQDKTHSDR
ncbi:hypothetical protein KC887_01985 [Candidatus Kaiserbacteria bacterium]|nr:hypothetical protein [Candidatus Kaiserbacteria bacterium]